jgi:hypothetical protein
MMKWQNTRSGSLKRPRHRDVRLLSGVWAGLLAGLLLLPAGCASQRSGGVGQWQGPESAATVTSEPWSYRNRPGQKLRSSNYLIHTTIENERLVARLSQVMEGALHQYRQLAPGVPQSDSPMECYLFATRREWADFTRRQAGPSASIYLQIMRGGYALGDRYVAFFIGEVNTYSVAAHEGWHQYVARHFKGRLPPFLEEGIACMFEDVRWERDLPQWNLSLNRNRAHALRRAIENRKLWPLEELVGMHAGDVVGLPGDRIEAFYAQSWAFAKFLWEAEENRYRPAMQRLLEDTANGKVYDPTLSHQRAGLPWNREAVRPLLEHYLGTDLEAVDEAYQAYIRKVAFEQFDAQWRT